ncbi:MAG: dihydropteroate synthase [Thermoplasmata archaeon]|nr:dihydropteroate synthase [Thermoplasmata archaeon]
MAGSKRGRRSLNAPEVGLGPYVLRFDEPRVMGILNCTPDSFSGDGLGDDADLARRRGRKMFAEGADVVDVGGESTRPGASPVPVEIEIGRIVPVIRSLSEHKPGRVSVDTMKATVAKRALEAGATIVNDVSGLRSPSMIKVVAEHDAASIIMHMRGTPRTMQKSPRYKDVVEDIIGFLESRISNAESGGVNPRKIMVDPGIGFGKTLEHNLEIIARLREFKVLGKPVVIGVSRKSFIGKLTGDRAGDRLEGSLAAAILAVKEGADMVRVHDVEETVRALRVSSAIHSQIRR